MSAFHFHDQDVDSKIKEISPMEPVILKHNTLPIYPGWLRQSYQRLEVNYYPHLQFVSSAVVSTTSITSVAAVTCF